MRKNFIEIFRSRKGAIGVLSIILVLFIIAAVGVTVYIVASGSGSSAHADLIPEDAFFVYTAIENKELSKKMYEAMGKTREQQMEESKEAFRMFGEFLDVEKTEKLIDSITNLDDAVGRVTFACSNLKLDITKRTVEVPNNWGNGGYKSSIDEDDYVEPPSIPPPPQKDEEKTKPADGFDPTEKPGAEKPAEKDWKWSETKTIKSPEWESTDKSFKPRNLKAKPGMGFKKVGESSKPETDEDESTDPDNSNRPSPEPDEMEEPDWADDDWTMKDSNFRKMTYETNSVKFGIDAMIILEIADADKFKEIGKKLDFDIEKAETKEHQGVKYYEIKALNFDEILKKNEDFELIGGGKLYASLFGKNLVIANGEANIKNIIDVQTGSAKSIKDNEIANKRVNWVDDSTCFWLNINYMINYFSALGDKNPDYKDFQEVCNALKLTDIESLVFTFKNDLSETVVSKLFVNPNNKYLKMLNEIPAIDSKALLADVSRDCHLNFAVSMKNSIATIEKIMKEARKDLPSRLTAGMPETLELYDFPDNAMHMLQHIAWMVNFKDGILAPTKVAAYKLADPADMDKFKDLKESSETGSFLEGEFKNNVFYTAGLMAEKGDIDDQMKTPRLNTIFDKLDRKYHLVCIMPDPKQFFEVLIDKTKSIDYNSLKTRDDFFVFGYTIEEDGISFTLDPMFDFAIGLAKLSQNMQNSLGTPTQQYQGTIEDSMWSEAKTAVGAFKSALDTYSAKTGDDLSGLTDYLSYGFSRDSKLLQTLRIEDDAFNMLKYFDAEDFSLVIYTRGKRDYYIITVDASKGVGGTSRQGPKTGIGQYFSESRSWTGKFRNYVEPPLIPPLPIPTDDDDEEDDASDNEDAMWSEAKKVVNTLKIGIEIYKTTKDGDISELTNGTVTEWFLKNLHIEPAELMTLKYFDAYDFEFTFESDGKDGEYVIKVDASNDTPGGLTEKGPKEGIGWYRSSDDSWHGKFEK